MIDFPASPLPEYRFLSVATVVFQKSATISNHIRGRTHNEYSLEARC